MQKPKPGTIGWMDLTVPDADRVKDFYAAVAGWKPEPVSMGEYNDYNMTQPDDGTPVAGVCHKRGTNVEIPSKWMVYIVVENIEERASEVTRQGGKLIVPVRSVGAMGKFCVFEDPAGAVAALYESV